MRKRPERSSRRTRLPDQECLDHGRPSVLTAASAASPGGVDVGASRCSSAAISDGPQRSEQVAQRPPCQSAGGRSRPQPIEPPDPDQILPASRHRPAPRRRPPSISSSGQGRGQPSRWSRRRSPGRSAASTATSARRAAARAARATPAASAAAGPPPAGCSRAAIGSRAATAGPGRPRRRRSRAPRPARCRSSDRPPIVQRRLVDAAQPPPAAPGQHHRRRRDVHHGTVAASIPR